MTGQEAAQILQKPIFGHPDCLEARDVLRVVAELHEEQGGLLQPLLQENINLTYYRLLGYGREE